MSDADVGSRIGDVGETIRVGDPVVVGCRAPALPDKLAVFEDDGETGYLYAAEDGDGGLEVLDALYVYEARGVRDADVDHSLQLVWNATGVAVALVINGWAHAMIDFERPRAFCVDALPPPREDGFVNSHAWDAAAFRTTFPSLRSTGA